MFQRPIFFQAPVYIAALTVLVLWSAPALHAQVSDNGLHWRFYVNQSSGTRVDYPAGVFSVPHGVPERGIGKRFRSADERAQLSIYALRNQGRGHACKLSGTFFESVAVGFGLHSDRE
jgi:hypothetical protein